MKPLAVLMVLVAQGCTSGQTCDVQSIRRVRDVCSIASSDDVIAHGRVVTVGEPRDRTFSLWPNALLAMTPVTIEVDRAVRGGTGRIEALVGFRVGHDRSLLRFGETVSMDGWFEGAFVDGELFVTCDGFAPEGADGSIALVGTDPPSFSSQAALTTQLGKVEADCPRRAITP